MENTQSVLAVMMDSVAYPLAMLKTSSEADSAAAWFSGAAGVPSAPLITYGVDMSGRSKNAATVAGPATTVQTPAADFSEQAPVRRIGSAVTLSMASGYCDALCGNSTKLPRPFCSVAATTARTAVMEPEYVVVCGTLMMVQLPNRPVVGVARPAVAALSSVVWFVSSAAALMAADVQGGTPATCLVAVNRALPGRMSAVLKIST